MKYTQNPYPIGQDSLAERYTHMISWLFQHNHSVEQFLNDLGIDMSNSSGRQMILKLNQLPITEEEYNLLKLSCDESSSIVIKEPCLTIFKLQS